MKELESPQDLEEELLAPPSTTTRPTFKEQAKALLMVFAMFASVLVVAGALGRIIPQLSALFPVRFLSQRLSLPGDESARV